MNQDVPSSQTTTTLSILTEIGEALGSNLPLEGILSRIVAALTKLIPSCYAVSIALMDSRHETITIRAAATGLGGRSPSHPGWVSPISELPTVQVMLETGTPLYIPDTQISPLWRPDISPETEAQAFLGVPLVMQKDIVGLLFIDFFEINPLTEDVRHIVFALARYAATAIHNAQQQEYLRHSEERYRLVANLTSNAMYELKPGSDIVIWSGDIDRLLRYPSGEFPRTEAAWAEAIHPHDLDQVMTSRETSIQTGRPFEAEYRLRRADDTYCHVLDRAVRLDDTNGPHMLGALSDLTNTYELTDALISSEVRYRTIFTSALDAIFIVDDQGSILDANPAAETLTGRDYSQLLSASVLTLAVPEETQQYADTLVLLRDQGGFSNREMRFWRPDQSVVHIEMWGTTLGREIYQLVAHDISVRQRAQALAAQRTAELVALSDLTKATASGGSLRDMLNRALPGAMSALEMPIGRVYLRERQTAVMRLIAHVGFDPQADPSYPAALSINAINDGRSTGLSALVRIVEQPSRVSLQVPLFSDTNILGLVVFSEPKSRSFSSSDIRLMDIVGRQLEVGIENVRLLSELEQLVDERTSALFATEMRYKSLIEQVPGIVYTGSTIHTGLTFISGGVDKLSGLSPADIMQNPDGLLVCVNPDDLVWVRERAAASIAEREDFDAQYRFVNTRTGEERWIHHRARPVKDGIAEVFWLGLLADVTKLKELDDLKSQFVATVSHELRTPLSAIKLRAATLRNYYERLSDRERLEMVDRISYQADILAELIEDVLRLAKLDSGGVERLIEKVDVISAGADIVEELQPAAANAELELRSTWADAHSVVDADVSDIARIWRNLISNAIKYTVGPGQVNIRAGNVTLDTARRVTNSRLPLDSILVPPGIAPGDWVVGIVEDTGRGISEFDQEHIFTRFFRGEAALTSIPGTGLGLSLVKELLEDYSGSITLRSQPGQGSAFAFWLPAVKVREDETVR